MKTFLAIAWGLLVGASIIVCCHPAKGSQDQPTDEELLQTVEHLQQIAKGAIYDLQNERDAHAQTKAALDSAEAELKATRAAMDAYKASVSATVNQANIAIAAHDHLVKQLHRAKWLACGLVIAVAAFVALKIPPPLGFYVGGGLAAAGIAAVWFWL